MHLPSSYLSLIMLQNGKEYLTQIIQRGEEYLTQIHSLNISFTAIAFSLKQTVVVQWFVVPLSCYGWCSVCSSRSLARIINPAYSLLIPDELVLACLASHELKPPSACFPNSPRKKEPLIALLASVHCWKKCYQTNYKGAPALLSDIRRDF